MSGEDLGSGELGSWGVGSYEYECECDEDLGSWEL